MKAYIANAARFIALFLSGALILSVLSCDMSVNSAAIDNPAVTVGEPAAGAVKADPTEHVTGVTITVSKEKIPSNGSDAVYITAIFRARQTAGQSGFFLAESGFLQPLRIQQRHSQQCDRGAGS